MDMARRLDCQGLSGIPCAGHDDGKEGTLAWHDAKPRSSRTSCWTSCWPAVIRRPPLAKDGLVDELKRALAERALNAEMDHHLDGEAAEGRPNSRNGYGQKTLLTDSGKLPISVPRDRLSTFDPQLIAKYRRRLPGFDDKIVSMYARGMTRPRDPGASGRALRHRRLARPDQRRHRRHPGRDRRVAEPAARGGLSRWCSSTRCG